MQHNKHSGVILWVQALLLYAPQGNMRSYDKQLCALLSRFNVFQASPRRWPVLFASLIPSYPFYAPAGCICQPGWVGELCEVHQGPTTTGAKARHLQQQDTSPLPSPTSTNTNTDAVADPGSSIASSSTRGSAGPCPSGVVDRSGACCASGLLATDGGCCSGGRTGLDRRGACCDKQLDACGVCGGAAVVVDVLVSRMNGYSYVRCCGACASGLHAVGHCNPMDRSPSLTSFLFFP